MSYSRNKVFSTALKSKGVTIIECTTDKKGFAKYTDLYRKHKEVKNTYDVMIVGFPGFVTAPFARMISKKKIILDALSSRYDSDIVSRNAHEGNWFKKLKIMLIDRLAFKSAHKILVETEAQKEFISHKFNIKKDKLEVVYTSVDETMFKKDVNIQKYQDFTVIFRGRIMNEAGVPTILKAAKILEHENINFDIIGYGWGPWIEESRELYKMFDPKKVHWDEKELPMETLIERMQKAHVSLGQFGKNERLERTIPHKAFESMVMHIPYITAHSKAVEEILKNNESCIFVEPENPNALAEAILKVKNNKVFGTLLAENAEKAFYEKCDSKAIGERLLNIVYSLL
jgi:glycosyltransferase involved in cell wall biosynthesis